MCCVFNRIDLLPNDELHFHDKAEIEPFSINDCVLTFSLYLRYLFGGVSYSILVVYV